MTDLARIASSLPMRFIATLVTVALLLGRAQAQPPLPNAVPPRATAYTEELQAAFSQGVALLGVADGHMWVEHYEPGGEWRGTHRGRAYAGRWSAENAMLCTQAAGAARDCATVYVTPGNLRDRQVLRLAMQGRPGTVLEAEMRVRSLARALPAGEVQGEVVQVWQDGFRLRPAGGGPELWARIARPVPGLFPPDGVTMEGSSDGLVFTAVRVTRQPAPGR